MSRLKSQCYIQTKQDESPLHKQTTQKILISYSIYILVSQKGKYAIEHAE